MADGRGIGCRDRAARLMKEPAPGPPILVAGLGRAGEAALDAAFQATGPAGLCAWDASTAPAVERMAAEWRARGVEIALGGDGTHLIERLGRGGTIVKSPGIEFDIPLLLRARAAGITCIDELEYGWRNVRCPVVGVTGTNGKSTTCALVAAVLRAASSTCQIVGNTEFGPPLSAAATENDFVVCEVSSFQLEASPTLLPAYAIFTNLTPEHLTRHLTMANYGDIKSRMFARADETCGTGIVNVDDPFGASLLARIRAAGGRALSYGFTANADVQVLSAEWDTASAQTSLRFGGQTHGCEPDCLAGTMPATSPPRLPSGLPPVLIRPRSCAAGAGHGATWTLADHRRRCAVRRHRRLRAHARWPDAGTGDGAGDRAAAGIAAAHRVRPGRPARPAQGHRLCRCPCGLQRPCDPYHRQRAAQSAGLAHQGAERCDQGANRDRDRAVRGGRRSLAPSLPRAPVI